MNQAIELFTAVPREHNCAQSVACGLGRCDLKESLASCGGGRAPEGMCGAIYAALQIIPEPKRAAARKQFIETLGSDQCAVLKRDLHVPCTECVALGAKLAEEYHA